MARGLSRLEVAPITGALNRSGAVPGALLERGARSPLTRDGSRSKLTPPAGFEPTLPPSSRARCSFPADPRWLPIKLAPRQDSNLRSRRPAERGDHDPEPRYLRFVMAPPVGFEPTLPPPEHGHTLGGCRRKPA